MSFSLIIYIIRYNIIFMDCRKLVMVLILSLFRNWHFVLENHPLFSYADFFFVTELAGPVCDFDRILNDDTYLLYSSMILRDFGHFFNCLFLFHSILLRGTLAHFLHLYRHRIRNLHFFARSGTTASSRETVTLKKYIMYLKYYKIYFLYLMITKQYVCKLTLDIVNSCW